VTLDELKIGAEAVIERVGGERSFRRRILELGLLPGATVRVLRVAPLGDPLELWSRGAKLSIRRQEAKEILVAIRMGKTE
jgi:Fe2+ transport system protein FeoA